MGRSSKCCGGGRGEEAADDCGKGWDAHRGYLYYCGLGSLLKVEGEREL